jgi:hypothetical protein
MAKTNTIEVKLEKAHNVYLPILKRLFAMQGGSMAFKRKVKDLYEELDAKVFEGLAAVREAAANLNVASEEQKAEAKAKLDNVLKLASEKTISLSSAKISFSTLPDENTILARTWNEQSIDQNSGQPIYRQGDYITDVVTIENVFFTEETA